MHHLLVGTAEPRCGITVGQLATATGLAPATVERALRAPAERKIIHVD